MQRRAVGRTGSGAYGGPARTLDLPPGSFVRGSVIVRDDGAWMLPLFLCKTVPGARWTGSHDTAALAVSEDAGKSWSLTHVPDSAGCVHMTIVPLGGARMAAFFRRRQSDFVYRTESADGGRSWSVPQPTDVPNNNSSIQARKLKDGSIALVFNNISAATAAPKGEGNYDSVPGVPVAAGEKSDATAPARRAVWGVPRSPLTIALSKDDGKTWPLKRDIQIGNSNPMRVDTPKDERRGRELSYPTVTETQDGRIAVAFTYFRRAIKYIRLSPGTF